MKRLIASFAALAVVAGFAFAQEANTNPNVFIQDFTKGLGKWVVNKSTHTQDAEGLKITKAEQLGGIGIELHNKEKVDLSAYKSIDFAMVNGGDKPIEFTFKIKSGNPTSNPDARTDDKILTLKPGEHTISFRLEGGGIELKEVNYIRIWTAPSEDLKLTIKKASFTAK